MAVASDWARTRTAFPHAATPKTATPCRWSSGFARGRLLFEGRCGDIATDWWHGMEPLLYAWATFRRRRLTRAPGRDG